MAVKRQLQQTAGSPERIASRAAARLAYLGETVEPLSPTAFEWRPKPAERLLFRTPGWIRVTCLPADKPGHTNVVIEHDPKTQSGKWIWGLVALLALLGGLFSLLLPPAWPAFKLVMLAFPGLWAALAGPAIMSSGALSRITKLCAGGASGVFDQVDGADAFLTHDDAERERIVGELADRGARITAEQHGVKQLPYGGEDRRSTVEVLGWPLWNIATGRDPVTDMAREARGWYARGQFAKGCVAVGQRAHGWAAVGQLAYGLVALGQAGIGVIAGVGQAGVGALVGMGQVAVGLVAAGMIGLGAAMAAIPPMADALGVAMTALFGAILSIFWLGVLFGTRTVVGRAQSRELERQLEQHRELERTYADSASLSLAERMTTSASPDRGLSQAEVDAEA